MAANAAALLDELMGRNRNALPTDRTKELSYNDSEVSTKQFYSGKIHWLPYYLYLCKVSRLNRMCWKEDVTRGKQSYLEYPSIGRVGRLMNFFFSCWRLVYELACWCLCFFLWIWCAWVVNLLFLFRKVCRYYLVRFCPHDLFHNTKADLGACPNLHDEAVRCKYEKEAPSYTRTKFEDEFLK